MSRFPQPKASKGSQRWLQHFVDQAPEVLNEAIGVGHIDWLSPLVGDEYAEYRDQAALDRLQISLPRRSLESFWPARGPQWDALGRTDSGICVLVEAKSHIPEIFSPATAASETSAAIIQRALDETRAALGALPGLDWSQRFYQYANRLAHLHLLQQLNAVPTVLVFLYFVGDTQMQGGASRPEWQAAIVVLHEALGLTGRIPGCVRDAFVTVPT